MPPVPVRLMLPSTAVIVAVSKRMPLSSFPALGPPVPVSEIVPAVAPVAVDSMSDDMSR